MKSAAPLCVCLRSPDILLTEQIKYFLPNSSGIVTHKLNARGGEFPSYEIVIAVGNQSADGVVCCCHACIQEFIEW